MRYQERIGRRQEDVKSVPIGFSANGHIGRGSMQCASRSGMRPGGRRAGTARDWPSRRRASGWRLADAARAAGCTGAPLEPAARGGAADDPISRGARADRTQVPDIDLDHVVVRLPVADRRSPGPARPRRGADHTRASREHGGPSSRRRTTARGGCEPRCVHDPAIAQVAYSYMRHALTIPNDPKWATAQSDYLSPLHLDRAWDISKGSGVTVADRRHRCRSQPSRSRGAARGRSQRSRPVLRAAGRQRSRHDDRRRHRREDEQQPRCRRHCSQREGHAGQGARLQRKWE